jgi:NAD(P)-dependent dehydrogenase (short-subunit alcohol dehydrogenase family)
MDIQDKVAIVTGGGAEGTGRAVALALARKGGSAVVSDIDPAGGRETVERIEAAEGRAAFVRADVRVFDDIFAMAGFAERSFGGIDIVVNNAGTTGLPNSRTVRESTGRRRSTSTSAARCSRSRWASRPCADAGAERS